MNARHAVTLLGLALFAGSSQALESCKHYTGDLPFRPASAARAIDDAMKAIANRDYATARALVQAQLEKEAGHTDAQFWLYDALGTVDMMQQHWVQAEESYTRALALQGLSERGRYEASLKIAPNAYTQGRINVVIETLERVQQTVCTPVVGDAAFQLASAYLMQQRPADAERALAPALLETGGAPALERYYPLDWGIQCALGRPRACFERFLRAASLESVTAQQAEWFNRLLPQIEKSGKATDLLQQARDKGWIDAKGLAVVDDDALARLDLDDLVPVYRTMPQYPRRAARDRISGFVKVTLTIAPDGHVLKAKVFDSKPRGTFDDAALDAIRHWRFKPKVVAGVPVESSGTQTIDFRME